MLSRIMRHPAGLMKKALGGRFGLVALPPETIPAIPPDYWLDRYSKPGFLLMVPPAPAPGSSHVGLMHTLLPEAALLPAQDGKASSYLAPASHWN
jgi:hypothetical protein